MAINSSIKKLVARATFKIQTSERGTGQCVAFEGGLFITAAHCVDFDCTGEMVSGDFYLNKIKTSNGKLITSTLAVEPVSDIAVLGSPDDQSFPRESVAFQKFCDQVVPVKLLRKVGQNHSSRSQCGSGRILGVGLLERLLQAGSNSSEGHHGLVAGLAMASPVIVFQQ